MGIIYKLTSPSGKSYIGQTTRSFSVRFAQHKREAELGSECPIHRAIRKYGIENFTSEILEKNIPENLLDIREEYYIQKYDTFYQGYNATLGGMGNKKIPDDIILELWEQGLCCSDIAATLKVQPHTISDRIAQLKPIEERQIRRYETIRKKKGLPDEEKDAIFSLWQKGYTCGAIGKEFLHDRHCIAKVLKSFGITTREIQERSWQTEGKKKGVPVYQYDKQGNFIQKWESMSEAGRRLNIRVGDISRVCSGERHTAGGFIWKKESQNEQTD